MSNELLNLISRGESGASGYNAYNRGTYVDTHGVQHLRMADRALDLSTMTLGEVMDKQHLPSMHPDRLGAVGKYQIIAKTMRGAVDSLNLDRDQPFTPELQNRIFSEYLIVDKRSAIGEYIAGKSGATLEDAQRALAAEWASFGDPDMGGRSHYAKDGVNKASITLEQSDRALNVMRSEYQAHVESGLSPQDAWAATVVFNANQEKTYATPRHIEAAHVTRVQRDTIHAAPHHAVAQAPSAHARYGTLTYGARGNHVQDLQHELNRLSHSDNALIEDGVYGLRTKDAVESFQHRHGLAVDGIAGPKTLDAMRHQALAHADRVPTRLDDPLHPGHTLYQQAREGVHKIDAEHQRMPDQRSDQLAAALVVAARRNGLTRIDIVTLHRDAEHVSAWQFTPADAPWVDQFLGQKNAAVPTLQGLNTPIEQSSQQWEHAVQQHRVEQLQPQEHAQQLTAHAKLPAQTTRLPAIDHNSSTHDMFEALYQASISNDDAAFHHIAQSYLQSVDGQAFLQAGRDFNRQQEAAQKAQEQQQQVTQNHSRGFSR